MSGICLYKRFLFVEINQFLDSHKIVPKELSFHSSDLLTYSSVGPGHLRSGTEALTLQVKPDVFISITLVTSRFESTDSTVVTLYKVHKLIYFKVSC